MRPDCRLDVDQETCIILRMYQAARQKAEDTAICEANPAKQKGEAKNKAAGPNTVRSMVEPEAAPAAGQEILRKTPLKRRARNNKWGSTE